MEQLKVTGGRTLEGSIRVQGAKNAVLPLMAAAVMTDEEVVLKKTPDLGDVCDMTGILHGLSVRAQRQGESLVIKSGNLTGDMPEDLCRRIRSSIFLLGPLLVRVRHARVPSPGGCDIGIRPIDLHLKGLRALGAVIREDAGKLLCDGENMHAGDVYLDYPSVGATENVMMAAAMLPGESTIHNAAREPEIQDLQKMLCRMGARIRGAGTALIRIEGVKRLHGVTYRPMPDRIVAGTLLCAGAVTGGHIRLQGARQRDLVPVIKKLTDMGAHILSDESGIVLRAPKRLNGFGEITTGPHPGFPTDMQSQMVALSSVSKGCSLVTENVFENRFAYAGDLLKMGADITLRGRTAIIRGVAKLSGAHVEARDLRGGAALVLAALCADGESTVSGVRLIDRGYEQIETMLSALNADVKRIKQYN